jgi:hypothetical protein
MGLEQESCAIISPAEALPKWIRRAPQARNERA